ncbi:TetR/AcrR family transcriptional regulator [Nocardia carnea]|uniref:TetR/AcrR family transcriptional regulator n=1 Tax=Nocardia carnea TaxID=37328 RepID=UPI002454C571|nr:TetR/AcrR family transcriptional regulator [Nocardia carnea]
MIDRTATGMLDETPWPPRVGRPRVHADEHILETALSLLPRLGYQALSIARIAEESGVSKPSVYRRWNNKAELISAAIAHSDRDQAEPTGDLRADLAAQLNDVRGAYERIGHMGMVGVLLSEESRHPEFLQAWRETAIKPRRDGIRMMVQEAIDRGQVRAEVDAGIVAQTLIGAFYAGYIAGDEMSADWARTVVDQLLAGILVSDEATKG